MDNDPKNLRGFSDHFAKEFVEPQISFWQSKVYPTGVLGSASGLMLEYYQSMANSVKKLKRAFSPPYRGHSDFPFHEIVINIGEVEMLKGIIGDNYQYLKNKIEQKKSLRVPFMDTSTEEKQLADLDTYLTHVVPNFADARERNLFIPFENLDKTKKGDEKEQVIYPQEGIFLSHSHKDKEIVRWFRNAFEEEGVKVWFDESEILPGDSLIQKISKGMKKSKFVAIFVSENLNLENMSQYVGWELSMAKVKDLEDQHQQGRLIPIMIGTFPGAKLPQEITDKNYADFRDKKKLNKNDPEFQRLLKKVKSTP